MEPDQHLQLPPAGGRRDAGAGARVRDVDGDRGARRGARRRPGAAGAVRRGGRRGSRSSSTPACGSSRRCARCARSCALWDEITRERYGVDRPKAAAVPLRRAGELARPDRGAAREQRAAHRAGDARRHAVASDARARAVQLPAWNEALGLPRPWDQQWSLRIQQVLAFESDLLEYDDLFAGSHVVEAKVGELADRGPRRDGPDRGDGRRGRRGRERLPQVRAGRRRTRGAGPGSSPARTVVVGVNRFTETEPNPLTADLDDRRSRPSTRPSRPGPSPRCRPGGPAATRRRSRRRSTALRDAAKSTDNLMPATLACARAGVTTGEWARRAARGVRLLPGADRVSRRRRHAPTAGDDLLAVRDRGRGAPARELGTTAAAAGRQARPGRALQRCRADRRARPRRRLRGRLPGHPAHARPRSRRPRSRRACTCVGLSILSGSHRELVPEVLRLLREAGAGDLPVVVGGIIPDADARWLRRPGRRRACSRRRTTASPRSSAGSSRSCAGRRHCTVA